MKNKLFLSLFLLLVSATLIHAQPGAYGTDIHASFKDEQGNFITPASNHFDIKWITKKNVLVLPTKWAMLPDTLSYKTDTIGVYKRGNSETILIRDDSIYIVNVYKTPGGGGIRQGAHFLIVRNNTDTMRLYPPPGYFNSYLLIDDICFRQGNYVIPSLVYTFHSSLKKEYRKLFRPNLYDDWELFRLENEQSIYKNVSVECIELFKNPKKIPDSSANWFYKEYFNNDIHYSLRGGILLGDRCHVKQDEKDENKHHLFGIIASSIFLYQKEKNGAIEFGYIKVPIDITGVEEKR